MSKNGCRFADQSTKSVVRTSKNGLGGDSHSPAKTTTYKLKANGRYCG